MYKTLILISCILLILISTCQCEKSRYISLERPVMTYYNPKFISFANISTLRYGRHDPVYYSTMHLHMLCGFSNNVTVNMYFCEAVNLMRTRAFLDLHFKFCDLIHKNKVLGPILKHGDLDRPCPYPPGDYRVYNMTVPADVIPSVFPFTKGRLFLNTTVTATNELMMDGYIDMEVKIFRAESKRKN